jgi:saccharopine dehydrogenase (NAD+, L-lysine-forming)
MATLVGVRREDKSIWERRVPLVPDHIRELGRHGIEVVIQPSDIRVFTEQEYTDAGATVQEDVANCHVVLAIKEIPPAFFRRDGVYMFFSHTIKGQPHNMPMLKRMMEQRCTLIDYERVVDESGRRLIFFGWHAGVAGMIETLAALKSVLGQRGIASPFAAVRQPLEYGSIREIKTALDVIGQWIRADGIPPEITPLIVGFAGYGNVSRGAQEMLDVLPVKEISPGELRAISAETPGAARTIFKAVFKEEHLVIPRDSAARFSLQDYYDNPGNYAGIFEEYLPYLTLLVNCIYWDERYPRLVTAEYLRNRWKGTRLLGIGDISCDVDGSIEVTRRVTDPGAPAFSYDVDTDAIVDGAAGNGPFIMAVDILPSELPRDSSIYFSTIMKEYIPALTQADYRVDFDRLVLPAPLKRAVILHNGRLTPDYEYIAKFLK